MEYVTKFLFGERIANARYEPEREREKQRNRQLQAVKLKNSIEDRIAMIDKEITKMNALFNSKSSVARYTKGQLQNHLKHLEDLIKVKRSLEQKLYQIDKANISLELSEVNKEQTKFMSSVNEYMLQNLTELQADKEVVVDNSFLIQELERTDESFNDCFKTELEEDEYFEINRRNTTTGEDKDRLINAIQQTLHSEYIEQPESLPPELFNTNRPESRFPVNGRDSSYPFTDSSQPVKNTSLQFPSAPFDIENHDKLFNITHSNKELESSYYQTNSKLKPIPEQW